MNVTDVLRGHGVGVGVKLTGDALPSHVLNGKKFLNVNGEQTGTMADYSSGYTNGQDGTDVQSVASNATVGRFDLNIPDGYHTQINAHILGAIPSNIKAGAKLGHPTDSTKQIIGTFTSDGTAAAGDIKSGKRAYVNGAAVDGSMPIRGADTASSSNWNNGGVLKVTPPNGFYDGSVYINTGIAYKGFQENPYNTTADGAGNLWVRMFPGAYLITQVRDGQNVWEVPLNDPDFVAPNIKNGTNIFGVSGTAKRIASGTVAITQSFLDFLSKANGTISRYYITVSGLTFTPSRIICTRPWNLSGGSLGILYSSDNVNNTSGGTWTIATYTDTSTPDFFEASGNAYVNSSGFQLPASNNTSGVYSWIAIE